MSNGYDVDVHIGNFKVEFESTVRLNEVFHSLTENLSDEKLEEFIVALDACKCDIDFTKRLCINLLLSMFDESDPVESSEDIEEVVRYVKAKIDLDRI